MPMREFADGAGRGWRTWDIRPDWIRPWARGQDQLAAWYKVGWLVFETIDASEKRRLCPYPDGWHNLPVSGLCELLERAERIPASKLARERSLEGDAETGRGRRIDDRRAIVPADDPVDVTDLRVVRSFWYPGGRFWSVRVVSRADGGPPVLRFSAGARQVDLRQWPRDWPDYPEERLIELLRSAGARRAGASPSADSPRRRHNDPPA
jgi:hypothetical protein